MYNFFFFKKLITPFMIMSKKRKLELSQGVLVEIARIRKKNSFF